MRKRFSVVLTVVIAMMLMAPGVMAGKRTTTVVVTANDLETSTDRTVAATRDNWFFYNDGNDTIDNSLGSFVTGPSIAPSGAGSAQISVINLERRALATYQFRGTPLAEITTLAYSTYNPVAGNGDGVPSNRSGYFNFNVDFDGDDDWQRRLVYVPSVNGTVLQDTWQEWDMISGGAAKWLHSGTTWPGTSESGSTPKTWSQILSLYPGVRIRVTDSWLGIKVGNPDQNGYTENIDAFKFGTAAGTTTFDFEPLIGPPTSKDDCKNGGWEAFNNPSFKNQGQCIKFVNTGK